MDLDRSHCIQIKFILVATVPLQPTKNGSIKQISLADFNYKKNSFFTGIETTKKVRIAAIGFHYRITKHFFPLSVPLQEFRCRSQQAVVCSAGPGHVGALLCGSGCSGLYDHVLHTL